MIKVNLKDGRGTNNLAKVSEYGQLVTSPLEYSEPYTASLDSTGTAFTIAAPKVGQRFIITDIILDAGKDVSASTAGTIVLYEGDSVDDTTGSKTILTVEMLKNTDRTITGLNMIVSEGVWLSMKTSDATVSATVLGYYLEIPKDKVISVGGADQVADPVTTLNNSLAGYWQLDETSGTRVDDFSGYDLTGLVGTPTTRTGKVDSAIEFDGSTSSIYGGVVNGDFDGTSDWSLAMWVQFDVSGTGEFFANVWGGSGRTWALEKTTNDKIKIFTNSTGSGGGLSTEFTSMTALSTATWYHIAFRYDSATYDTDVFVDGTTIGTHNGQMLANSTYVLALGGLATTPYMDGAIDSMAYWTRQLTDDEFLELAGVTQDQPF